MVELERQIKVVAKAREEARDSKDTINSIRSIWESDNKAILDDAILTATVASEAEQKLRELTLKAYAETGNKAPAEGVGIREVTKLNYDPKIAFDWAKSHKMALKLDVPAFDKIAKASQPDFVKITQEPQATIAQNLEV